MAWFWLLQLDNLQNDLLTATNITTVTDLCAAADCGNGTCEMRSEGPFCICNTGAIFNGAQCIDPSELFQV